MLMNCKTLIDVFPNWLTGQGIFSTLQNFDVPWKSESITSSLDLEYFGNISGNKYISPLIEKLISGDVLTENDRMLLATAIMAIYGINWSKQWITLNFDYNPIENYSMTEQMENDKTINEYGKTRTKINNLSHTKTGNETQTPNLTNATENLIHGFNSTDGVPTGSQNQTASGTNTTQYNVTDADTGTQNDNDGGQDVMTHNYKLTRSGNIGVTTSQQMIESERNLWVWNFFHDVVFPDLDKILSLQIY